MDYTFPWEIDALSEADRFTAPGAVSRRVFRGLHDRRRLWRFLSRFAREIASRGGTTWLVGGIVRDLAEGRRGNDVDLMVTGVGFEELGRALRALPASRLGIRRIVAAGKQFPVYKVKAAWTAEDVDVAPARGGPEGRDGAAHRRSPVEAHLAAARTDAGRRDLTINALMVRLGLGKGRVTGEVIDFFGGLDDLRRRRIRGVADPEERFSEDPLRILRAIRQKNERPGYVIEARTWSAIRRLAPGRLVAIPGNRTGTELARALMINPVGTLDDLARAGVLALLIPEWKKCPPGTLARTRRRYAFLRRSIRAPLPSTLLFANLLADIAEIECRKRLRALKTARRASGAGSGRTERDAFARLPATEAIARRLGLPRVRQISWMMEDLVRLTNTRRMPNPNARIEAIFKRWENPGDLLALYEAAQEAAGRRMRDLRAVLRRSARVAPLISGRDLLAAGVPEGPAIEPILESVREATLAGGVTRKDDALALAVSLARSVSSSARRRR